MVEYAENPPHHLAAVVVDELELYTMFVLVEEEEEEVEPVPFLIEEDQEGEEVLVVECDAHSAPLNAKGVVKSVAYLNM